jgi:hypothetical protein
MAEDFIILRESSFLRVESSKSVKSSNMKSFIALAQDIKRDASVHKVLVDARGVMGTISTLERYKYASLLAEHLRGLQVAFVLNKSMRDFEQFGETVAINRGAHIRVFIDLENAYEWLL